MARIGLLGGSFDPPHNGHLAAARAVLAAHGLDRVDLLVARTPPHRAAKQAVAAAHDRAAMAWLAVEGQAGLGVESCELSRPGPSYSIDTVRALRAAWPGNHYEFIVGADMLADLANWREADALLGLVSFVPVMRPGFDESVFESLPARFGQDVVDALARALVRAPLLDVSSSRVRAAVAAGESISAMVPTAVERFIHARGLYRA